MTRDEVFNMIYPFGQPTQLTQSATFHFPYPRTRYSLVYGASRGAL